MPTRGDAPSAPVRPAPSARRRGRHAPAAPPKRWPPPPPIRRQRRHTGRRRKNRRSAAPTASEAAERGTRSRIEQSRHGAASPLPLPEPRADTRVGCATMPAGPVHSRKASGGRERRPGSREAENEADSGLHSGKAGEWARRASGAHREARGRGDRASSPRCEGGPNLGRCGRAQEDFLPQLCGGPGGGGLVSSTKSQGKGFASFAKVARSNERACSPVDAAEAGVRFAEADRVQHRQLRAAAAAGGPTTHPAGG